VLRDGLGDKACIAFATKYISHKNGPAESIAGFQICLALCTVMLAEISLFAVDCFHNDFAVLVDHITHSLLCGKCFVASSQVINGRATMRDRNVLVQE